MNSVISKSINVLNSVIAIFLDTDYIVNKKEKYETHRHY